MKDTTRNTAVKNRLLDSVGEGEGGMIWENATETCILPYVKQMISASSMHETGHLKPVLWGNPEEWGREGSGRALQDGRTHVYLWLIHINIWQKTTTILKINSFQFSHSVVSNSATPWITARQASLSITNSRSSLKLTSIESVMPSSHLILCCPLLLLPPIPPSIRVFSNESTLRMRWPKYWSFNFTSFLPKNTQDWSLLEWAGWIPLQSKGLSRVFSYTTVL